MTTPRNNSNVKMVPSWRRVDLLVEKPFTYPSITGTMKYLPIANRRQLVRGVGALRTLNKEIPFFFKKVLVTYQDNNLLVSLDECLYVFQMPIVDTRTVPDPVIRRKLEKFFRNYLGHPDTFIANMKISVLAWRGLELKAKVGNLWLDWHNLNFTAENLCTFRLSTQINILKLDARQVIGSDWVPVISTINAKELMMSVAIIEFPESLSQQLPFPVLKIGHSNFMASLPLQLITKFREEAHQKGSAYSVRWEYDDSFWEFLKTVIDVEESDTDNFSTSVPDPNLELVIVRKQIRSQWYLGFAIADKGTVKTLKTQNHWFYGRVVRFQERVKNFAQASVTKPKNLVLIAAFVAFLAIVFMWTLN